MNVHDLVALGDHVLEGEAQIFDRTLEFPKVIDEAGEIECFPVGVLHKIRAEVVTEDLRVEGIGGEDVLEHLPD